MNHTLVPVAYYSSLGGHPAAIEIDPGDSVTTMTIDAHGYDEHGRQVAPPPNPMNGPIAVRGAEPGDSVAVHIEEIVPSRDLAWTRRLLAPHILEPESLARYPELVAGLPSESPYVVWRIDRAAGVARPDFSVDTLSFAPDEATRSRYAKSGKVAHSSSARLARERVELALAPMIGCIGTAADESQSISTRTSGPHGGNMDYVGVRPGATIHFPVFVPGGMLYFGDGHATQGHGEIGGTGTEVSMKVRVRIELKKQWTIRWPRGENETHIFAMGNARPLDQAVQHATTELFDWLTADYGLDTTSASLLLAQGVEYDVGNIFDPAYTMVCKISKRLLS